MSCEEAQTGISSDCSNRLDTNGAWLNPIILDMTFVLYALARVAEEKLIEKCHLHPMPHQLFYRGVILLMVILSGKHLFLINASSSAAKSRIEAVEIHVCWIFIEKLFKYQIS